MAQNLCNTRGGKFYPATPLDPKRELLSEMLKLTVWSQKKVNDLSDSAFIVILPGGKKDETGRTIPRTLRLLPYKNERGLIDKVYVRNALARVNQVAAPASVKRAALKKLLRVARGIGIEIKRAEKIRLSELDSYLELLEKVEGLKT